MKSIALYTDTIVTQLAVVVVVVFVDNDSFVWMPTRPALGSANCWKCVIVAGKTSTMLLYVIRKALGRR